MLVEVGVTVDGAGHRETGLERREYDQGQHDAVRPVLAVGTAGALVRRDVWDALGGLDPLLPLYRDDLDLGWRVNAAGHRVVVVPAAVLGHVRAATTGRRRLGAVRGSAEAVDRQHALFVLLAHASPLRLPLAVLGVVLGALARAVGLLLTRQPAGALLELRALAGLLGTPWRLRAARRRRGRTRVVARRDLVPLMARRRVRARARVQALGDWLTGGASGEPAGPSFGDPEDVSAELEPPPAARPLLRRPAVLLLLALALVTLVAERGCSVTAGCTGAGCCRRRRGPPTSGGPTPPPGTRSTSAARPPLRPPSPCSRSWPGCCSARRRSRSTCCCSRRCRSRGPWPTRWPAGSCARRCCGCGRRRPGRCCRWPPGRSPPVGWTLRWARSRCPCCCWPGPGC